MSLAYTTLFDAYPDSAVVPTDDSTFLLRQGSDDYDGPGADGSLRSDLFSLSNHPRWGRRACVRVPAGRLHVIFFLSVHRAMFAGAETRVLSQLAHAPGKTKVAVRPLGHASLGGGLIRVDITNMTRDVNHHFESALDGHQRKYRLHVEVNETATTLALAVGAVLYPAKLSVCALPWLALLLLLRCAWRPTLLRHSCVCVPPFRRTTRQPFALAQSSGRSHRLRSPTETT